MSSSGDLRLTLLTKAGRVASVMDASWRSEPCIAAMEHRPLTIPGAAQVYLAHACRTQCRA